MEQAIAKAKVEGNTDSDPAALHVMAANYVGAPLLNAAPSTDEDAMRSMLVKLRDEEGDKGLYRLLLLVGEYFPDVEMSVNFTEDFTAETTAAAE